MLFKRSNLWRLTLLVIRHKNVVNHAESLLKILNFEPEDEWNSITVAAFERISSRKKAKTQFEPKAFLILLIVTRMIYLSENRNNSTVVKRFHAQNWLLFWLFINRVEILPISRWEECSRYVPARKSQTSSACVKWCIWWGIFRKISG